MHDTTVVPDEEVADLPLLRPNGVRTGNVAPDLVEEGFALGKRQAYHVGVLAATEVKGFAAVFRVSPNHGMYGTRGFEGTVRMTMSTAQGTDAVVGRVVLQTGRPRSLAQAPR